jgi:hypothetical protein
MGPGTEELPVGTNGEKQIQIAAFVEKKKRPTEDSLVIRTLASGPQPSSAWILFSVSFARSALDQQWVDSFLFFLTKASPCSFLLTSKCAVERRKGSRGNGLV